MWYLRLGPALCGSLLVPVSYQIIILLGYGQWAAGLAATLILLGMYTWYTVLYGREEWGSGEGIVGLTVILILLYQYIRRRRSPAVACLGFCSLGR